MKIYHVELHTLVDADSEMEAVNSLLNQLNTEKPIKINFEIVVHEVTKENEHEYFGKR